MAEYTKIIPWKGFGALAASMLIGLVLAGCGKAPPANAPTGAAPVSQGSIGSASPTLAVGPQYDSVHVYVEPGQFDAFVRSWTSTFGGTTSTPAVTHVTPSPSTTRSQLILSPVGTLSVFEFLSPIPYPFGAERGGWLMTDLDAGVTRARAAGASVLVAPFSDPIGRDAVIQFPGGINTQLYWHTTAPSYPMLQTVPDNRVYLSPDAVDDFLRSYRAFTSATVTADDTAADGALIGKPGNTFRQIHLTSAFGGTTVLATDGQLPYPYGRDVAGYAVADVATTLSAASAAGATVLARAVGTQQSAILQFPGGYIAEIHHT